MLCKSLRLVIRTLEDDDLYLNAYGKWTSRSQARQFASQEAAERFAFRHGLERGGFGLFPVSKHRHIPHSK